MEISRCSNNLGTLNHHFFGFHDLLITNKKEDKILSLEVNEIDHPPYFGETAKVGYISSDENQFVPVADTTAWNFPQGARQQWLGDSDLFIFNNQIEKKWGSQIIDSSFNKVIQTNLFPVHCLDPQTGNAYYMNYSRVHRVGGYGYVGLRDSSEDKDIPNDCGIFLANIKNGSNNLLLSLADVANCDESTVRNTGFPHYVTHLYLNPSGTSLAFLHRYRLADGGETTRLLVVDVNGANLRCVAKGFLSHFTWLDDNNIIIWGQKNSNVANLRESEIYNSKVVIVGLKFLKIMARGILSKVTNAVSQKSFLKVSSTNSSEIETVGKGILIEDGHPMLNPLYKNWLVSDTYPNVEGNRTLLLFNINTNDRIDLSMFRMLDTTPDINKIKSKMSEMRLDKRLDGVLNHMQYFFTRSGLHCDLHPRWSHNGKSVFFDSIHEGTRQIYKCNVENLIS